MPTYCETRWPASLGWCPTIFADAPVIKGGRIVTGSLGPLVRCVKEIAPAHVGLSFEAIVAEYGTQPGGDGPGYGG